MKCKKFISGILTLVLIGNTLGSSLTSFAAEQSTQNVQNEVVNDAGTQQDKQETEEAKAPFVLDTSIAEVTTLITKEDSSFSETVQALVESEHFYEVFHGLKEETKTTFFDRLTKEEVYQFGILSKYAFVKEMITYQEKEDLTEADMNVLASYIDIYGSVVEKQREETIDVNMISTLDTEAFQILTSSLDEDAKKDVKDLSTYADYLQTLTDLDVTQILNELDTFTCNNPENHVKTTKEFKNFVYATYGFDELVEKVEEDKQQEENKKDEGTEDGKAEDQAKPDENKDSSDDKVDTDKKDETAPKDEDTNTDTSDENTDSIDENGNVTVKPESKEENNNGVLPGLNGSVLLNDGQDKGPSILNSGGNGIGVLPYNRITPRITYYYEGINSAQYSRSDIWFAGTTENTNNPSSVTLKLAATPAEWNTSDITSVVTYNGGSGSSSRKQSYKAGSIKSYIGKKSGSPTASLSTPTYNPSTGTWTVSTAKIDASPSIKVDTYITNRMSNGSWAPVKPGTHEWGYFYAQDKIISCNLWVDTNSSNTLPSSWSIDSPASTYYYNTLQFSAKGYDQYLHIAGKTINGKTVSKVVKIPASTYTVKYNGNGATSGSTASSTHAINSFSKLTKNGFVRSGYQFLGWNVKADGSGKHYSDEESVLNLTSAGGTVTLYAQWVKVGEGIYVDGSPNGSDSNHGRNPENPVRSLKRAYEIAKTTGGTIYIVYSVPLKSGTTLSKTYYKDSTGTVSLNAGKEVQIKRYSQPKTVTAGFNVKSNTFDMLGLQSSSSSPIVLKDIVIDGHKDPVDTASDKNTIAPGVIGGSIIWGYGTYNLIIENGAVLKNNHSDSGGGAIYLGGTSTLKMTGGTITGNIADKDGGAIDLELGVTFTMTGGTINKNTAYDGGGIYLETGSTFTMSGGIISENSSTNGGGVYWASNSSFTMNGGSINGNEAKLYGGGVCSDNGNVTLTGSGSIRENIAMYGGGVYNKSSSTFTVNGGSINRNEAKGDGGGIYNSATCTVNNGSIVENRAKSNGGGAYNSKTFYLTNGIISGNTSQKGNGIYQNGTLFFKDQAKVDINNDVYLYSDKFVTISGKLSAVSGKIAKITPSSYNNGKKVVEVAYNSKVASDEYDYSDGSLKFLLTPYGSSINYELRPGDYLDDNANIADTDIIISQKYNLKYDSNGKEASDMPLTEGVYWNEPTKISNLIPKTYDAEFGSWNTSSSGSGTEYNPSDKIVLTSDKTLYAQWVPVKSAYIYIDGINGSDTNNGKTPRTAVKTFKQAYTNAKTVGGTIFVVNTVTLNKDIEMTSTGYKDDTGIVSLEYGKKVMIKRYSQPDTVTTGFDVASNIDTLIDISGGTVHFGEIVIDGHKDAVTEAEDPNVIAQGVESRSPLIYNYESGILNINDGAKLINNINTLPKKSNLSIKYGGAIYNKGEMYMDGGEITENCSNKSGGGGIFNEGILTIHNGEISRNIASENLSGSIHEGGHGGGIHNYKTGTVTIDGGKLSENRADTFGGGIYSKGTIEISDGEISGNSAGISAGGIDNWGTLSISGGKISDNTADTHDGGAIKNVKSAELIITGGEISGNTSEIYGGAIVNTGVLTIEDGKISKNVTNKSSGGAIMNNTAGVLTIKGGEILENSANSDGGGIANYGTLNIVAGEISKNTSGTGGAIYNIGKVSILGGSILDNIAEAYGGAINNGTEGVLNIENGEISGNTATNKYTSKGGGIFNQGTLTMIDGEISRNSADRGGGIYNENEATVSVSGGIISENSAVRIGDGIYNSSILNFSDKAKVDSNNDVYLDSGKFITVIKSLTSPSGIIAKITPSNYENGRKVVEVAYDNKVASDEYSYTNDNTKFELTPKESYAIRPGDYLDDSAKISDTDMILSTSYTVSYDENGVEASNMPAAHNFYWKEAFAISDQVPIAKEDRNFLNWNTNADNTGDSYQPSEKVVSDSDLKLFAQWESEKIRVIYEGNGATGGSQKTEIVSASDCENGYAVKSNDGYTSFEKENFGFAGWDSDAMKASYKVTYKKETLPKIISFEELTRIAEEQEKVQQNTRGAKASDEMLTATMYAVWDKSPTIDFDETDGTTLEFYEGETVTKKMLLEKVSSTDFEDDAQNLPLTIRITKIQYADGKLVDGKPQKGITETWETDMPDDYQLDTWFLQMEKDSTATHTITYAVTDSFGNTTERDWTIKVKYNNFPEIKGEDRYFTLEEAQSGAITYEELMSRARAWDKEDCAKESCMEGHENCLDDETLCDFGKNNLKLVGFDAEEFTAFTESGYVVLNYSVKDRFNKETFKQFVVYISKDGEVVQGPETKHVRFIDEANYDKNASVSQDGLSEEELEALNQNGGLHVGSKWYTEEEYRDLLLSTLEHPTSEDVWFFEYADIEEVKTYVKEHGVGNSESDSGLSGFLDSFQGNKQN